MGQDVSRLSDADLIFAIDDAEGSLPTGSRDLEFIETQLARLHPLAGETGKFKLSARQREWAEDIFERVSK